MGILDVNEREAVAGALLGDWVAKTSGYFRTGRASAEIGWLYVGRQAFVFIADKPMFQPGGNAVNERTIYVPFSETGAAKLFAPRLIPNARIEFERAGEFMGARRQMKVLMDLWTAERPV
jgi:hypothetical protein